jgi:hypothetical protein
VKSGAWWLLRGATERSARLLADCLRRAKGWALDAEGYEIDWNFDQKNAFTRNFICKAFMSGSNGQDQDHSAARSDLCAQMDPREPVGGFPSVFGPPE